MKRRFVDALQREVIVSWPPKRIISLVPSISETLSALKLEDELVAVTKFCERPVTLRDGRAIIGGTKDPKIKEIFALKADLIIANKEENKPRAHSANKHQVCYKFRLFFTTPWAHSCPRQNGYKERSGNTCITTYSNIYIIFGVV